MSEPVQCDYCGRPMHTVGDTWVCRGCRGDYDQGTADYHAYKDALMIGGEDLAVQMEMEAEFGYMG